MPERGDDGVVRDLVDRLELSKLAQLALGTPRPSPEALKQGSELVNEYSDEQALRLLVEVPAGDLLKKPGFTRSLLHRALRIMDARIETKRGSSEALDLLLRRFEGLADDVAEPQQHEAAETQSGSGRDDLDSLAKRLETLMRRFLTHLTQSNARRGKRTEHWRDLREGNMARLRKRRVI